MKSNLSDAKITAIREEVGFLPYFSDYFCKGISYFIGNDVVIMCIVSSIALMLYGVKCNPNSLWFIALLWIVFIIVTVTEKKIINKLRVFGYRLKSDHIEKDVWNKKENISYTTIIDSLHSKEVIVKTSHLEIPYGTKSISIPFEIGSSKQQTRVNDFYNLLNTKVDKQLPDFKVRGTSKFDRAFFYNRSFWRCLTILVITVFLNYLVNLNATFQYYDSFLSVVIAIFQCFFIVRINRSTYYGSKNYREIVEAMSKKKNIKLKLHCHTMWESILISILVIIANIIVIFSKFY